MRRAFAPGQLGKGILETDPAADLSRRGIENRLIRRILEALGLTRRQIERRVNREGLVLMGDELLWAAHTTALGRAILPGLEEAIVLGMEYMAAQPLIPIGVDWALVHGEAMEWARSYRLELVRGISGNTRKATGEIIANWIESGDPLKELSKKLEPIYGRNRAKLIAETETTRAFQKGNEYIVERSGLDVIPPSQVPPKHPRCRCTTSLRQRKDGKWVYVWQTANVPPGSSVAGISPVCPLCWELHKTELV